ncbi:MAG: hydantoinase B/oxoprolinase family protein [Oscillospiraceae bacterium]|nr:hydantoinase B/oxoprolinase family protein [Oscillospiraceae bacterium]
MSEQRYIEGTDIPRVPVDPITLQVLGGEFKSVAQEMGMILYRMSYSSIIRESEDLGAGICDTMCRQICESENSPMHAGSVGGYIKGILTRLEGNIHEGDVIIHNDPHHGASHAPDVQIVIPIFYEGTHIGYSAINAHLVDIGNSGAGVSTTSRDAVSEATVLYALKLYENGKRNDQLWQMILDNTRTPSMNANDIDALIAAAEHGKKRFLEVVEKYGLPVVFSAEEEWFEYTERILREQISKAPDGVYYAEEFLDDDGIDLDTRLKVACKIIIEGDHMTVDLSDSSPQVPTAVNCPFSGSTKPAINTVIHSVFLDAEEFGNFVPQNEGLERPITFIVPEGNLFNPRYPAATSARFNATNRLADTMLQALAQAVPRNVAAGCSGNLHYIVYSGYMEDQDEFWVYGEVNEGCYGGRPGKDGMDTVDCLIANTRNMPVEESEWHYPIRVERYEMRDDVPAAPGQWRGGKGIIRNTSFLSDGYIGCEGDGHYHIPKGLFGGMDGAPARFTKNSGKHDEKAMISKPSSEFMKAGDSIQVETPCGGGYGDPLEREPELVLEDILDGFAWFEQAERDYGVVIDQTAMTVDLSATQALRAARKS